MAEQNKQKNTALEKALPAMAKDIASMKMGIMKLVAFQTVTPRAKAEQFFTNQATKEAAYEAKLGKSPTRTTKSERGKSRGGKGLGLGPGTSVLDFIKNIANMLIKGALIGAGVFGLSKLLENEDVRSTIKTFIKNLFVSILNVIQKGAQMLSEMMKENWPEIREVLISTFLAIKDLLITGIRNTGDLLSDKRIWEGLYEVIKTIFEAIKKVLSTEVEIEGVKVSLGTVLGSVILAFGALKGAVFLLKAAAESAAKSLFGIGGRPEVPDVDKDGKKKKGPYRDPKTGRFAKAPPGVSGLLGATSTIGAVAATGAAITYGATSTLEGMSKEELNVLAQSGDDTAIAAAILAESKKPTPSTKGPETTPSRVYSTTPLTPEQAEATTSETKKLVGKNTADFIAAKEGFAAKAYLDPPGNTKNQYSIGYGHLIQPHEVKQGYISLADNKKIPVKGPGGKDTTVTKEEGKLLLNSDLPKYEKAAADPLGPEAWSKLNDEQKTALISYAYNAGSTSGLVKAGLKDAILKGDMQKAADIIYQKGAKTAGGKFLTALEKRRLSESVLFASGKGVVETPAEETKLASATPSATPSGELDKSKIAAITTAAIPSTEESPSLSQLLLNFDKMLGGKLGLDSKELAAAINMLDKEVMSGSTIINNSTNVNQNRIGETGPISSAYDADLIKTLANMQA
jgi:GH24 family phage-related lysozyme (muramidase)